MANRYIRDGAAVNGNGTTNAIAASPGADGAWNTLDYLEGVTPAYGTLPAGATIIVRSKNAAGNNILRSYSTSKTLGAQAGVATLALPINWVIDDGTEWPGVVGTITYLYTVANLLRFSDYNNIYASAARNFIIYTDYAGWFTSAFATFGIMNSRNLTIDCSLVNGGQGPGHQFVGGIHENLLVKSNTRYNPVFSSQAARCTYLINPSVELLNPNATTAVFQVGGYGASFRVHGGEVYGTGTGDNVPLVSLGGYTKDFHSYGLKFPRNMKLTDNGSAEGAYMLANGSDGAVGNEYADSYCYFSSRADNYPPTLNANLELSTAAKWSYKLVTKNTAPLTPAVVPMQTLYTQDAAVKTVTLELLWPTSLPTPTKSLVWILLQYIDHTTGLMKSLTTHVIDSVTPLDASTSEWSTTVAGNTTWGAILFTRYKLAITTPTSIKKDTAVIATLCVVPKASSLINDVIFVDTDLVLT